jgi:hypothetical protein
MLKKDFWITPFVWFELPRLPSRHNAYYTVPRILTELRKRLRGIHNVIPTDN